ncbi:LpqB family beta-propeller domain-containing protein [Pseudonocardia charpentierae]|uniref:LpqB family beta-propeller domain-containing protein n=1 Tax=Pseudonocardia charpentierae TaxID=3075545 RepID=A0ABU2N4M6_9PSEU|nr:LpqB family beta-propeller domain-containing protein [Pseudonocardia sp. DSM 45834]MDT0348829.1 LpqB family beta-propeller domain-containing protein [Pseudonocardia sp. DSM 45834]
MSDTSPTPRSARRPLLLVLLLVLAGLAGCASVPESSPVQVLRRVGDGDAPVLPPGPAEGSNALDLVRGFVYASGSSPDRHGAARRFLAPEAADWDDGTGVTVLSEEFDTVYPTSVDPEADMRTVRIRGTALGKLTPGGWFEASQAPVQIDVNVVRRDGQWRIARLPGGVLVRMSDFRVNYRTVKTWFVDPVRRVAVPDLRYLPSTPARAQAARAMELLFAGPSAALQGAASSMLVTNAQLRSNVATSPEGSLIVDLTQVGDLDEGGRRLLAAQVVLSLAEVSVGRVRLLADGAPLLPSRPDLTRDDVVSLIAEPVPATAPALVVYNGRVHQLNGAQLDTALPGQVGNGELAVQSAAASPDGRRIAVVAAEGARRRLLIGGTEGPAVPTGLGGATMARPSWTPTGSEAWTVVDSSTVARVVPDADGNPRLAAVDATELTRLGPVQDLRLSRDGLRVAAVVRGGLYAAALARSPDGDVTIRNVRALRPADIGDVVAVDWRAAETVVAVSRRADGPVSQVSVDGLSWELLPGSNLTPPLRAVAAAPNRPVLVTDQSGVWSFAGGELETWRQVVGGVPDAVPLYPG